jgi:hypothetical protein
MLTRREIFVHDDKKPKNPLHGRSSKRRQVGGTGGIACKIASRRKPPNNGVEAFYVRNSRLGDWVLQARSMSRIR